MDSSPNLYIADSTIDDRIRNHFLELRPGSSVAVPLRDVAGADAFEVKPFHGDEMQSHKVLTNGVMVVCQNYAPNSKFGIEQEGRVIAALSPAKPHGYHFKINLFDGVQQDRIHPVFA